jgi:integrase
MKVTTFTDVMIRKLKPETKEFRKSEGNGFTIRVMPSGVKTWLYLYTIDEKRRCLNLGQYPDVKLEDARTEFEEARKKVKKGIDPLAIKEQEKDENLKAPTVKELGADYIKRHAEVNKKSWEEDQRILDKEVYPAWGKRKAADIIKRDVITLLDKVVDRGSPQTANNIFKILRKLFNWAVEKDRLKISPCIGIKAPAPLNLKDRAFSVDEIKAFWKSLDGVDLSMTNEVKRALRLILITAQRPGEVSGIHTREIDGNWWTIPAERSKNGKAHRVYLPPLAMDIITDAIDEVKAAREIPAETKYEGFVFPCPHRAKDKAIERHALSKALKRNESEDGLTTLGVATFTPHDLRRTAATFMAESGELDEVIDAVLNHSKQGIIKVYNLYRYDKEKQLALDTWARKLISITTGKQGKVVPMKHKAA